MNCEGYQGKRLTAGSVIALKSPLMARVNDWTIDLCLFSPPCVEVEA